MASKAELTLTAWAVDNASGPLKQISDVARKMPEGLSKASSAMNALGGAAQQIGGPIAGAASKITGLIGLIGTGGPLGVGIAAVTGAVALGVTSWEAYTAATRYAEEASRALDTMLRKQSGALTGIQREVELARERLESFGKSAEQSKVDQLAKKIEDSFPIAENYRQHILKLQEEVEQLSSVEEIYARTGSAKAAALGVLTDMQRAEIIVKQDAIRNAEAHLAEVEKERAAMEELIRITNELTAKEDAAAGAKDRKARKAKDATAATEAETKAKEQAAKEEERALRESTRLAQVSRDQQIEIEEDLIKKLGKANEDRIKGAVARAETEVELASMVGDAMGQEIQMVLAGQQSLQDAFKATGIMATQIVLDMVQRAVMMYAVEAAAAAYVSQAAIPIAGPVLGAAAAAVALGVVRGYLSQMPKAAQGGLVTGGRPGEDSVPIMAMPGELILPVALTRQILGVAQRAPGGGPSGLAFASGGMVPGGGGRGGFGGNVSVSATFRSFLPPSAVEQKRIYRSMAKQWSRGIRSGQLKKLWEQEDDE